MKILLSLASLLLLSACSNEQHAPLTAKVSRGDMFFENSKRSTVAPPSAKVKGIGRIKGCTGFFLQNDQDKNYFATARHCFHYFDVQWCKKGGEATDSYNGKTFKCRQLAVGDQTHDLVIFELENGERDRSGDFELGDFELTGKLPLAMLGYPGDLQNPHRNLKLTEHCWVQKPRTTSIYDLEDVKNDQVFTHNCSTYGGNSGGPLFVAGTRVAVGIPDQYEPNDFKNYPQDSSVQGILSSGFVADFREKIAEAGIKITTQVPEVNQEDLLTAGTYGMMERPGCEITLDKVAYDTSPLPVRIKARLTGPQCNSEMEYACNAAGVCKDAQDESRLELLGARKFQYYRTGDPGVKWPFQWVRP